MHQIGRLMRNEHLEEACIFVGHGNVGGGSGSTDRLPVPSHAADSSAHINAYANPSAGRNAGAYGDRNASAHGDRNADPDGSTHTHTHAHSNQ